MNPTEKEIIRLNNLHYQLQRLHQKSTFARNTSLLIAVLGFVLFYNSPVGGICVITGGVGAWIFSKKAKEAEKLLIEYENRITKLMIAS